MSIDKKQKNLKNLYDMAIGESSEVFSPIFNHLKDLDERYSDWQHIATGGMKRVFRVRDKASERFVALAKLHENAPEEHYDSFIREARLTGKLEHPNIMTIHDIGINAANEPYFTMELKCGGSLDDILTERRSQKKNLLKKYKLEDLLVIFIKVCDAISYAHSKNVIHLDLKPANIQVGDFGEVLVCDWGLGKVIGDQDNAEMDNLLFNPDLLNDMTLSGQIKGTPGYMAPEQIKGKNEKDFQTDIYALGCILYSLLTDCCPVDGSTEQKIDKVVNGQIKSPLSRFPDKNIPNSLNAVVVKAMSVSKENRYRSVTELRSEVQQFISGYATSAEDAGLLKQATLFWQRNSMVCRLTASFVSILLVAASVFVYQLKKGRDEAQLQKAIAIKKQEESDKTLALYLKEKKQLQATQVKWSADITLHTDPLRYHFFYDSPKHYIKQTLKGLNKAIEINPGNERALGLIGHQYFMMQQFQRANEAFTVSFHRQEDIYPISKKFATLKNENELLTVEQLTQLISEVGKNFKRRHHLCERLLAWDAFIRKGKIDYSEAVKELLVIDNNGKRDFLFDYDSKAKSLSISGLSINKLAEDNSIGSGQCLLRFIDVKSLVLMKMENIKLSELDGMNSLEVLDISQISVTQIDKLSKLPKLRKVILSKSQHSKILKHPVHKSLTIEIRK